MYGDVWETLYLNWFLKSDYWDLCINAELFKKRIEVHLRNFFHLFLPSYLMRQALISVAHINKDVQRYLNELESSYLPRAYVFLLFRQFIQ